MKDVFNPTFPTKPQNVPILPIESYEALKPIGGFNAGQLGDPSSYSAGSIGFQNSFPRQPNNNDPFWGSFNSSISQQKPFGMQPQMQLNGGGINSFNNSGGSLNFIPPQMSSRGTNSQNLVANSDPFYGADNNILLAVIIYSSVMNIAFTVTPMFAPGSAALLTLFRLSGIHRCCPTWGFGFHPSLSMGVCANAAVYFKAISPMTQPHRFLVSLHIHDTTYSFRISPCPLCSLL